MKDLQVAVLLVPLRLPVQFLAADPKVVIVPFALAKTAKFGPAVDAVEDFVHVLVHLQLHSEIAAFATEDQKVIE
jgi:hypothetical protein